MRGHQEIGFWSCNHLKETSVKQTWDTKIKEIRWLFVYKKVFKFILLESTCWLLGVDSSHDYSYWVSRYLTTRFFNKQRQLVIIDRKSLHCKSSKREKDPSRHKRKKISVQILGRQVQCCRQKTICQLFVFCIFAVFTTKSQQMERWPNEHLGTLKVFTTNLKQIV